MRTAAYVRVSKEVQELEGQREDIERWSQQEKVPIDEWYEDHGGRRHEADVRPGFQRLFADVQAGKVQRVIVSATDRIGFDGAHELFHWLHLFYKHNCSIVRARDNLDLTKADPQAVLTGVIDGLASRAEMTTKAERDLKAKIPIAAKGQWTGGWIPYGCAVACYTPAGALKWTVEIVGKWDRIAHYPDGREDRITGKDKFHRDRQDDDVLRLVPSRHAARHEAIRMMFDLYGNVGWSYWKIADHLNALGPDYWHPHQRWYPVLVRGVLANPAVIGLPQYNKQAQGRYAQITDGRATLDAPKHPTKYNKGVARKRPRADWIGPSEPIFPPLVDPELFRRCQERLNERSKETRRTGRSETLWGSGLIHCAHCGQKMIAWHYDGWDSYTCKTYRYHGVHNEFGCKLHRVKQAKIEELLDAYLEETGQALDRLAKGGENRLLAAVYAEIARDRARLTDVRQEMERYLMEALREVIDPIELPDGRLRFEIPHAVGPDEPDACTTLDLPGAINPQDLEQVYSWVAGAKRSKVDGRVAELNARQAELYEHWAQLSGLESAQRIVRARMDEVNAEIRRLKSNDLNLEVQVREVHREIGERSKRWRKLRREFQAESAGNKANAARKLLAAIECRFEYRQHGKQLRSHLCEITFRPQIGEPHAVPVPTTEPTGKGRRAAATTLAAQAQPGPG